jgi:putative transcriptional regulator
MERSLLRAAGYAALVLLLLTRLSVAGAAELDVSKPLMLVAKRELVHPLYSRSVLVVKPFSAAQHVGFIINRPTELTLGKMFPEHGPSQKVVDPVYLGGPVDPQMMFALVERAERPTGRGWFEIAPQLFAVFEAPTVDRIIESEAEHARFLIGLVVWRPGELEAEIDQGAWHVMDLDRETAMREPTGLWDELQRKLRGQEEQRARTVRASLVVP